MLKPSPRQRQSDSQAIVMYNANLGALLFQWHLVYDDGWFLSQRYAPWNSRGSPIDLNSNQQQQSDPLAKFPLKSEYYEADNLLEWKNPKLSSDNWIS